ncbi:MAG TPA: dethiobiotin synthase [Rhabdochlamydiaceae bacterium]|jgi:dethiobiotin synthetase
MQKIIIAGIGTNVGKTVISAILTLLLDGVYWKPIQCGTPDDSAQITTWLGKQRVHPPAYCFQAPLSPHHAARLEKREIIPETITPPQTSHPLIIESVGGILVPLKQHYATLDLFATWKCRWIVVCAHYLGSINHTLLTLSVLKQYRIPLLGIIFNAAPHPDSESAILGIGEVSFLARVLPESILNSATLHKYAKQWQSLIPALMR